MILFIFGILSALPNFYYSSLLHCCNRTATFVCSVCDKISLLSYWVFDSVAKSNAFNIQYSSIYAILWSFYFYVPLWWFSNSLSPYGPRMLWYYTYNFSFSGLHRTTYFHIFEYNDITFVQWDTASKGGRSLQIRLRLWNNNSSLSYLNWHPHIVLLIKLLQLDFHNHLIAILSLLPVPVL